MSVPLGAKSVVWLTVAALLPWVVIILAEMFGLRGNGYEFMVALLAALTVSLPLSIKLVDKLKRAWLRVVVLVVGANYLVVIFSMLLLVFFAFLSSESS